MKDLKDRVVMITGTTSGIGRACALAFADEGCNLVICARRKDELEKVADIIRNKGRRVLAIPTDVSKENQVKKLAEKAFEEFGKVDIAMSNAGIAMPAQTHLLEKADWEKVMGINFYGAVHVVRYFLQPMVERREGHIIVNASGFGLTGAPYNTLYSTSKYALIGFTECLRAEMAQFDVGVTTLCSSVVNTSIFENAELKGFNEKARDLVGYIKGMSPETFAKMVIKAVKKDKGFMIMDAMTRMSWGFKRLSPKAFEVWLRQMPKFSNRYLEQ